MSVLAPGLVIASARSGGLSDARPPALLEEWPRMDNEALVACDRPPDSAHRRQQVRGRCRYSSTARKATTFVAAVARLRRPSACSSVSASSVSR